MNRFLLVAVVAAVIGGMGAAGALSQQVPLPTQIGYIDVGRAWTEYRKRGDIEKKLNEDAQTIENAFTKRREEIEELKEQIATLNPNSDEFQNLAREIDVKTFLLKRDHEAALVGIDREARKKKGLLYREICLEAGAYAEANGLAAVMLWDPLKQDFAERGDLELVMNTRTVLWRSDRLDITNDVIEVLNSSLPK